MSATGAALGFPPWLRRAPQGKPWGEVPVAPAPHRAAGLWQEWPDESGVSPAAGGCRRPRQVAGSRRFLAGAGACGAR